MMFLACALSAQAKNFIVCVGIADYPGTDHDLYNCANDARVFRQVFLRGSNSYVRLLTDSCATVSGVLEAMEETFAQSREGDTIIFFFSGHGAWGSFACYDAHLEYQQIFGIMKKSQATRKLIFADACYAGKVRFTNKRDKKADKQEVIFFLSSRDGESSRDSKQMANGYFTAYLTRGLRGAADANRDKTITARELFEYVNNRVSTLSNNHQHPVMWGKFDDNTPVIDWNARND